MRPHRLRVTAFGPFPGTVDLDLDEVSGAGPFLLRGATGAGKTSLLDAVGYALFGRVPGSRGLKQLRSDHAPDGVRTSVELWATVGGRAVHVVRTPDQRRPRARGTGTTTDKATVTVRVAADLTALQGDEGDEGAEGDEGVVRLAGVQEANDELARLVGMTHEQFLQVVLLPQGDFARFLRAKDDERAEVLRALFDTRRFLAVEHHLREQRDAARALLAAADSRVDDAAARVAAVARAEEFPPSPGLAVWARGLLDRAEAEAHDAAARAATATAAVRTARADHAAASGRARGLGALVEPARTEARLLGRVPQVRALADELAAADRAAGVVVLHDLHELAVGRLSAARDAARAALSRLGGLARPGGVLRDGDPDEDPGEDPDDERADGPGGDPAEDLGEDLADGRGRRLAVSVDAVARDAVVDLTRLQAAAHDVRRHQEQVTRLRARGAALAEAEDALAQGRAALEALPGRAAGLRAGLEVDRSLAAGLTGARHEVERWVALRAAAGRLAGLVADVAAAEGADLDARGAARAAEAHHDDLRRARLAGMSGELARGLVPGEPCSVCGATQHPAPAESAAAPVGPDEEEAAGRVAAAAATAATLTAAELAGAAARRRAGLDALVDGAAPDVAVPPAAGHGGDALLAVRAGLEAQEAAARDGLAGAEEAAGRCEQLAAELDLLREEQEASGEVVALATAAVAACATQVRAGEAEVERLVALLREALGGSTLEGAGTSLTARHAALLARADERARLARAAADAVAGLGPAHEDAARCAAAAAAGASAAGWSSAAEAVAAARPAQVRERARAEVSAHERDVHAAAAAVRQGRTELAAAGVALEGPPGEGLVDAVGVLLRAAVEDEGLLAARLAGAEALHTAAAGHEARSGSVRDELRRAVPRLLAALGDTGPLRERAEAARSLADLCTGSNDRLVPLSTYVLAAHLAHVVEAANLRLDGMSEGRYALVHVEEGEDRRRRAGLGLAVLDAWTGRRRPTGTLSGGETFLTSLALALGLADVVGAEAGGARIDALFVDEGFGTLDPDSLDRAMDVLDQLQEHGRMVGVVSHVGELRLRLPRQVHVEAGRAGSTVQVLTG